MQEEDKTRRAASSITPAPIAANMCERSMQERKSHRRHGGGALLSVLRELSARTDLVDVGAQREPTAVALFSYLALP